jgi:small subunit ribosomal protein S16
MAVHIRMTRTGRLNRPFYRIGVYDQRTRRDGRIIEQIGYYDPLLSTGQIWKLDRDRLDFWMKRGAQPSETIAAYLKREKVRYFDGGKKRERNKRHAADRKEARRRTGRTVEASAKPLLPKKPGGTPKAAKPAKSPKAPKPPKEETPS